MCAVASSPEIGTYSSLRLLPDYRKAHLNDLERIPLDHGSWRPIRRPLAITGFAVNAHSAESGESVIEPHDETSAGAGGHQELYLVASRAEGNPDPLRRILGSSEPGHPLDVAPEHVAVIRASLEADSYHAPRSAGQIAKGPSTDGSPGL